jgi:hypothetical protein
LNVFGADKFVEDALEVLEIQWLKLIDFSRHVHIGLHYFTGYTFPLFI